MAAGVGESAGDFELTGRRLTQHKPLTLSLGSSRRRFRFLKVIGLETDEGECPERQRGRTVNPLAKPS